MDKFNTKTVSNAQNYRNVTQDGRNYLIVPAIPVREQVMNNYYVPASELTFASMWNGTPVTIRHPKKNSGSANVPQPDVAVIGRFFNSEWNDGEKKLTGEYWIDVDEAMKYVEGQYIINAIYANSVLETSTGYWADEESSVGEFGGRNYTTIHRNLRPDHIAILVDEIGACSVADGCGVNRNSLVHKLYQNECLYGNGGFGSGDFGHLGRPGQVGGSQPKAVRKDNPKSAHKKLNGEVKAYYVATKARAQKYRGGYDGSASLMNKAKAQNLFDSMTRGGFDPVIFEIKLKKGSEFTRMSSGSITVPSIPKGSIHEISPEELKKRSASTFKNSMQENDCGCPDIAQLNSDSSSLTERIEKIRTGFYREFMHPVAESYVRDIFDGYVIVEQGEDLFKAGYKLNSDGEPTFDPSESWTKVGLEYVEQEEEDEKEKVSANVVAADAPAGLKSLYERVYAEALKSAKGDKAKASRIAWGAVKKAGWVQDEDGKWHKKGEMSKKNNSVVSISTKEKNMSKVNVGKFLDMLRGKGVDVQLNSEAETELGDLEMELEEEVKEEVPPVVENQFTAEEVTGLKKLAAMDWTRLNSLLESIPSVLEVAKNAEAERTTKKNELIGMILNSGTNPYSKEELEAMPLPVLTKMNGQLNVSYALSGGMFVNTSADEEALGLPRVSLEKE